MVNGDGYIPEKSSEQVEDLEIISPAYSQTKQAKIFENKRPEIEQNTCTFGTIPITGGCVQGSLNPLTLSGYEPKVQ